MPQRIQQVSESWIIKDFRHSIRVRFPKNLVFRHIFLWECVWYPRFCLYFRHFCEMSETQTLWFRFQTFNVQHVSQKPLICQKVYFSTLFFIRNYFFVIRGVRLFASELARNAMIHSLQKRMGVVIWVKMDFQHHGMKGVSGKNVAEKRSWQRSNLLVGQAELRKS